MSHEMKAILIKLWEKNKISAQFTMNAEGRFSYLFPPDSKFDMLTIEPNDPDSKVTMTHYGAKYSP